MSADRFLRTLIIVIALVVALASVGFAERALASDQRFAPRPAEAYADFAPLREPRADLPIGALWIQGYGPHGEPASASNLETIRGINGLTISRNLQVSMTLGLFDLLGIDPGLRNQVSARFSDLSIVRVRDLSQLAGPSAEPRIYEALKAGSVVITTDRNLSLNLNGSAFNQILPANGRGSVGHTRGSTLEARDMFIAFRIVTPSKVRRFEQEVALQRNASASVTLGQYRLDVSAIALRDCVQRSETREQSAACGRDHPLVLTMARPSSGDRTTVTSVSLAWKIGDGPVRAALPVPLPDDNGGLLGSFEIEPRIIIQEIRSSRGATRFQLNPRSSISAALEASRLQTLMAPTGWSW